MSQSPAPEYAGDLSAREAWELLRSERKAQLVDVRSVPEWNFVGLPDLSPLEREVFCIAWQSYPAMQINPDFVQEASEALQEAGAAKDTPVVFLCRSGARSRAAAIAMTRLGFQKAFNILGGFEGEMDANGHRGAVTGWKAAGLPWRQS
jgi:rhodanese-related sulfurtransferase